MSRVLQAQAGLFCLHLSSFGAMVPSQDCFSGWFFPGSVHAGNGTIQAQHQRTDPLSFREDGFKEDVFKEDGFKDGSSVASSKSSATRWVENSGCIETSLSGSVHPLMFSICISLMKFFSD